MKHCIKCLIPETHEATTFDENGVCSVCRQSEKKDNIDWDKKKEELKKIVKQYKNKGTYDCIIPASFGKDSSFSLLYAIKDLGLRALVVCCNHGFMRDNVMENRKRAQEILGFDIMDFTVDRNVVKKLMLESLKRTGDWCYSCHCLVYALPMHLAIKFNIPLLIWGESSMEYTSNFTEAEEVDEKRFNKIVNLGQDVKSMAEAVGIPESQLWMMKYPETEALQKINCRSICLGNYIKWDTRANVKRIKEELKWQGDSVEGIPPEYDYEKIECQFQGMRDYCLYLRKGFGRTAHLCAIDLRNGRMTKEKAEQMIAEYDGIRPECINKFLDYIGIGEDDFYKIMETHKI